ncbi:MAG: PQQ-binding-like beta-propeller repeat protein [Planctomycetota bacterium]
MPTSARTPRLLCVLTASLMAAASSVAAGQAQAILDAAGVKGGLIVHLGCGDGTLTAALRADEGYCVHGLDTDPANVQKAREHLRKLGVHGAAAVDTFDGARLPYADNVVNLLVAARLGDVPEAEVLRVLAPGGVAVVNGRKLVKPRPDGIDDWTHYLHDADNNAVAQDTVVGPPRRLQWQCGPKWTRHHDRMSSFSAMVSSGGRIFYIIDQGSTASIFLPSRWTLVARDAFNGKRLWMRRIGSWYYRLKGLKDGPADAPRRLVAKDGRVYATLGLHAPLSCLDAETGETLRDYEGTKGTEEVLLSDGVLFLLIGPGSIGDGRRGARPSEKRTLMAVRAETGKKLWEATDEVAAMTPAADARRLYYYNFVSKKLVALDRKTGQRLWASEPLPAPKKQRSFFAQKLVVRDGVVLLASGEYSGMIKSTGGATKPDTLTVLAAATGKTLWQADHPPSGYSSPEDLFVIGGLVWCGTTSNGRLDGTHIGRDLETGAVKHKFPADETNYWFHHRCYSGRATSNYIITSRTGLEFIDFREQHWDLHHWVRGACLYGIMPCNGLVYAPPAPCICYAETFLHSFNAFAPGTEGRGTGDEGRAEKDSRLERGPAYQSALDTRHSTLDTSSDWPTYRGDNARSGRTPATVPATLAAAWEAKLGGKLSALTAADGNVFVAAVDDHAVHALAADSGEKLWHYTAGGRVDSPPTCYRGRLLFGSADGWVYCLRASDGALAWRFRAAPADRRILVYEQVESLWPVHGSVLVRDGVVHCVAGRSAFVDGGMRLCRLDAKTGKLVSETVLDDRDPETGRDLQERAKWLNMPVARPDVLSCDGERLYMRSQAFDLQGKRLGMGPKLRGPKEGARQGGEATHLFCPTGFLDDTWFHRTYWLYGSTWGSGWCGYFVAGKHAPAGKILCVGDDQVYVFGRQPKYYRWTTPMEYRLFAARKQWKPPAPPAKGKRKRRPAPVANKANYAWSTSVPILVRAMMLADGTLFIAGPRDVLDETEARRMNAAAKERIEKQEAAWTGQDGAVLWAVSTDQGRKLAELALPAPPVFDGMAAAGGRLLVATTDGRVLCLGGKR